jgi:hypothetical protein
MDYLLCINNEGYELSLTPRKVYALLPDETAAQEGFIRVVDDTDEDYCFPKAYFIPVKIPAKARPVFAGAPTAKHLQRTSKTLRV